MLLPIFRNLTLVATFCFTISGQTIEFPGQETVPEEDDLTPGARKVYKPNSKPPKYDPKKHRARVYKKPRIGR